MERRGYPGEDEQGRGQQPSKCHSVLQGMHVHPEEHGMRSLLLQTLPIKNAQNSSIRNRSKQAPNQGAYSVLNAW